MSATTEPLGPGAGLPAGTPGTSAPAAGSGSGAGAAGALPADHFARTRPASLWRDTLASIVRQRSAQVGLIILGFLIFTAIFASLKEGESRMSLLIAHGEALVIVSVFAFVGSLVLYKLTDLIIPLRVTPEQEQEGLDLSQHGETALGADVFAGSAT